MTGRPFGIVRHLLSREHGLFLLLFRPPIFGMAWSPDNDFLIETMMIGLLTGSRMMAIAPFSMSFLGGLFCCVWMSGCYGRLDSTNPI